MSFSEFLQWIRNFFSSRSTSTSNSTSGNSMGTGSSNTASGSSPSKPESSGTAPSQPPSNNANGTATAETRPTAPPPVEAPTVAANSTTTPTPRPPEVTTSPSLPETSTPVTEPTTPPPLTETTGTTSPSRPETTEPTVPANPAPIVSQPTNSPPVIDRITTSDTKVALNREVVFQVVTRPANQYADCSLDLSNARHATVVQGIDSTTGQFTLSFDKASSSDNDTQLIKVNNPQGQSTIAVTVSLMKLFWSNHPGRKNVCDETLFVNQCAIRMGAALELSGIKLTQDRRVLRRCTTEYRAFKHHKEGLVNGHVLAAQELANWIKSQRSTFGSRSIVHSQEEILGRSGVIFFRDGWGTTDHIDVWDGQALVGGFPSYFDAEFKELWFWDVY